MASAFALAIFSGIGFLFGIQKSLRAFLNPLFTSRVVTENGLALSVTYGDRLPLLSPAVTKGGASGETGHFAVKPKSLPQCRTFAESGTANAVYLYAPSSENAMPERPRKLRHCSLKNYSSAEYGRSKA